MEISEIGKGASGVPSWASDVTIDGFHRVKMAKSSLQNLLELAKLELRNIGQLQLEEQAMAKAPGRGSGATGATGASKVSLRVRIFNCSIAILPRMVFTGHLLVSYCYFYIDN